jgi:hypothetical protein
LEKLAEQEFGQSAERCVQHRWPRIVQVQQWAVKPIFGSVKTFFGGPKGVFPKSGAGEKLRSIWGKN